ADVGTVHVCVGFSRSDIPNVALWDSAVAENLARLGTIRPLGNACTAAKRVGRTNVLRRSFVSPADGKYPAVNTAFGNR
ncbi:MAG: hypothetical protein WBF12_21795, partial [Bradyrhizobium sp.]